MPKLPHEALVQLVRAAPRVITTLLRPLLGALPEAVDVELSPQITAAELVNLDLPERRADVVITLGDPKRPDGAIVVEAQGEPQARKRRVWPFYVTGFAVRFDCPVLLAVLTLDEEVAAWCREPIDLGFGQGVLRPCVLGPREIPVVTDPALAAADPELAVLSVLAHGREPGAEFIARAALVACERLDSQAGVHYADFIDAFLGRLARIALGSLMQSDNNPYFSQRFRETWNEGWAEGVLKGKAEGKTEGKAEGKAHLLLRMLRLRGWTVPAEQEARVLACRDEAQIERWTDRVLTAATLDEVLV